jgi:hypothetical protein
MEVSPFCAATLREFDAGKRRLPRVRRAEESEQLTSGLVKGVFQWNDFTIRTDPSEYIWSRC